MNISKRPNVRTMQLCTPQSLVFAFALHTHHGHSSFRFLGTQRKIENIQNPDACQQMKTLADIEKYRMSNGSSMQELSSYVLVYHNL